jgi:hypothetical protein
MASTSVPGMHSWGNLHYSSVLGALGSSPFHGGGLRAPFFVIAYPPFLCQPRKEVTTSINVHTGASAPMVGRLQERTPIHGADAQHGHAAVLRREKS